MGRQATARTIKIRKRPTPAWTEARNEQHRLKREVILKAAATCFYEKGYAGTSLSEIAAQLNITNNALYYYFQNKEELAFQCFMRAHELVQVCVDTAEKDGSSGLEKLDVFVRELLETRRSYGELPQAGLAHALSAEHQRVIREAERRTRTLVTGFIEKGIQDHSIRQCDPLTVTPLLLAGLYWGPRAYSERSSQQADGNIRDFIVSSLRDV